MEYEPFDLADQKGIIVVPGGNIEHRQERVASANTAHVMRQRQPGSSFQARLFFGVGTSAVKNVCNQIDR